MKCCTTTGQITHYGRLSAKTYHRTSNQAALIAFLPVKQSGLVKRNVLVKRKKLLQRTNAVSSCGLEISDGLARGFEGPGEDRRDWTGVLDPSPLVEPFAEATLRGWAASGDDIGAKVN